MTTCLSCGTPTARFSVVVDGVELCGADLCEAHVPYPMRQFRDDVRLKAALVIAGASSAQAAWLVVAHHRKPAQA